MYSQIKVELCSSWGMDRDIANSAWASSKDIDVALQRPDEDVRRVVSQIVSQGHGTPKERVFFEFYMEMPIFVERHLDKYRHSVQMQDIQVEYLLATPDTRVDITQNELSGRYRTIPERFYTMPKDVVDICAKAQAAPAIWHDVALEEQYRLYSDALKDLKAGERAGKITNEEYKRAREVLRGVLGTSFITSMRLIVNLHSFEHIVNQRLSPHAQLESRILAARMVHAALPVAPVAIKAMIEANGWQAWLDEVSAAAQDGI